MQSENSTHGLGWNEQPIDYALDVSKRIVCKKIVQMSDSTLPYTFRRAVAKKAGDLGSNLEL